MTTTDFNYDTIEYTEKMSSKMSGVFKTCGKEEFEKEALNESLFERIPDDKPVKFYFDCDHKFYSLQTVQK